MSDTPPSEERAPGRPRRVENALTTLATAVALLVSVLTLVVAVFPALKPQAPPEKLGGKITKVGFTSDETYGEYRERIQAPLVQASPQSKVRGLLVTVRVDLQGHQNRRYLVSVELRDSRTRRRASRPTPGTLTAQSEQALSPKASEDAITFRTFIPDGYAPGRYYLHAELYDLGETGPEVGDKLTSNPLLDFSDSSDFRYPPGGSGRAGA